MGGAITGAFSVTMPDPDRANASNHGDMPSAFVPLPALTAMATPSPGVMPRADRSSRKPLVANDSAAWPVSHRAATSGVIDDGATGEPPQENITTRVDDRMPELRVFTPPAPPDPRAVTVVAVRRSRRRHQRRLRTVARCSVCSVLSARWPD